MTCPSVPHLYAEMDHSEPSKYTELGSYNKTRKHPVKNVTWILDKFESWNVHGLCLKNDGISIGFFLIFDQTAVEKT